MYSLSFNLIAQHKGKEVTHALNKTCSPSLPWSLREVTCEVNYMEVSFFIMLCILKEHLFELVCTNGLAICRFL